MKIYFYDTKIGKVAIVEEDDYITNLFINQDVDISDYIVEETSLIRKAYLELEEYLNKKRKNFDLPIKPHGTKFMLSVWNELLKIPYGEVRTYQDIAIEIKNNKSYRAVGMACNKNPIPIFIPCHRVIGKSGNLVGYALGLNLKEYLLNLEKIS